MRVGVPVLDTGQRGHYHLHKPRPSLDLSPGFRLRLWGQRLTSGRSRRANAVTVDHSAHLHPHGLEQSRLSVAPLQVRPASFFPRPTTAR